MITNVKVVVKQPQTKEQLKNRVIQLERELEMMRALYEAAFNIAREDHTLFEVCKALCVSELDKTGSVEIVLKRGHEA